MGKMFLILQLLLVVLSKLTLATDCDKNMNYHEDHGYGYDILCKEITDTNIDAVQNIVIDNEFSLHLDSSNLHNVTPKLFNNVLEIVQLTITNSSFLIGNQTVFVQLGSLRHLKIIQTEFLPFIKVFEGLKKLEELELSGNKLQFLDKGTFLTVPELRVLKINNNLIKHVKDVPLCDVKRLNFLSLEGNLLPTMKYWTFSCNKHRDTIDLNLNNDRFNVGITDETYLNTSDSFVDLVSLNFNRNNIADLGYSLTDLKNVKHIELEDNALQEIKSFMFESLTQLEVINLKQNKITYIDERVFFDKPALNKVNLEGNQITNINLNGTTTLEYLNLANNKLILYSLSILSNLKSLKQLIISNNQISEISPNEFRNFTSLETLDLSANNLTLHAESFNDLLALKILILSHNNLRKLPSGIFNVTTRLKTLDLSHNSLTSLPQDVFANLQILDTLDLSSNMLTDLRYVLFKPLKGLNVLDIAGNRLKSIQYDQIIDNLPSLTVFNVKSNWLSCDFLFKMITFLKEKRISYTINEKFEYEKVNVEGVYCTEELRHETSTRPGADIKANQLIGGTTEEGSFWPVMLIVAAVVVIAGFGSYKMAIFYKRRRYMVDQFELIEGQQMG